MKIKFAKKDINQQDKPVLQFKYCCAQSLLSFQEPLGYSIGGYGWECDYYETPKAIISTGSSPIGIRVDYNIINRYNEAARSILKYSNLSAGDIKVTVNNLLLGCINELLGGEANA